MSEFERPLPTYRLVQTHHGDTLQSVAHREMGDANRWPELVWINSLRPPYITDDERRVADGVILSGGFLKIPAPQGVWTDDASRGQVYERDAALDDKLLAAENGDLVVVAGADNLRQQLTHRVVTPRGQLVRHPEYGCRAWRLMGGINGPTAGMLAAQYVKATLAADYRVASVEDTTAEVIGDTIRVSAKARAIEGGVIDVVASS